MPLPVTYTPALHQFRFGARIARYEWEGLDMSHSLRKWFYAFAAVIAATLTGAAGTAAAATLPGIAVKAPLVQNDVLPVGYRHHGYDDGDGYGYRYGGYVDDYEWATQYYAWLLRHPPPPPSYDPYYPVYAPYPGYAPSRPAYRRDYDDGNAYDYSNYDNGYDYSNNDNYYYERWLSYTSEPDRYYGTRAPVEAYEKDDYYVWLPPSQPRSCGEYHYWTGFSCVDARHFKPYVGPKW